MKQLIDWQLLALFALDFTALSWRRARRRRLEKKKEKFQTPIDRKGVGIRRLVRECSQSPHARKQLVLFVDTTARSSRNLESFSTTTLISRSTPSSTRSPPIP